MVGAARLVGLAVLCHTRSLTTADDGAEKTDARILHSFHPQQILIKKFIGQVYLATESFSSGGSPPLDVSRSFEQTGMHVRLFEADLVAGSNLSRIPLVMTSPILPIYQRQSSPHGVGG